MKILVTGSAGFIGYHLCTLLLKEGHCVIGVDNFNDYYDVNLKEARNKELENFKNFKICRVDIAEYADLEDVFQKETPNAVINLAAQAGVRHSIENPHIYGRINLQGFLNILELCRHYGAKKLLYASSSSVYGKSEAFPSIEDEQIDKPISLYAATKKANELMAHSYHHLFGLTTIGFRFFNAYGEWNRPDMALSIFTKKILAGETLPVFNEGKSIKDFTYVGDIAKGIYLALKLENCHEIFNLGYGQNTPLMTFIDEIEKALGQTAAKDLLPLQAGDVPESLADNSKAKNLLGWKPEISVREGIERFVQWHKSYYSHNEI